MTSRECAVCGKRLSKPRSDARKRYCHRCELQVMRARAERAHDAYICRTYGTKPGFYRQLYDLQGGRCWICQRATGARRRLAVDHDHSCCRSVPTCGRCNRGLLCKPCNRLLGHARDDPAMFRRAAAYLDSPPAGVLNAEQKG